MILRALLALWTSVARPMGDHLWQSTLFLAIAAILALALRKNQARVRYWVWLTASIKFLIPFSLLIALGSHLARPRVSTPAQVTAYSTVENFSQPFAGQQMPVTYHPVPTAAPVSLLHLLPAMLVAGWLVGIAVVLLRWVIGWVRISLMVRKAARVSEGPEVDALRRLESSLDVRRPIRLVLSPNWMEPGIFGIFRPVLIWPEGISKHLDDKHIKAILAHEVSHVRRHDNFTAVLHMLVEAVFWFHPLVWWMGARLEEERERACDEEVSLLCNQPHVYAESILRVCKFCSESPLACVSGITGADLKKRIVQIMTERVARKLDLRRKLLLAAAAAVVVAAPLALGMLHAADGQVLYTDGPLPSFEVATIRPMPNGYLPTPTPHGGSIVRLRFTPKMMIMYAYNLPEFSEARILNGAGWTEDNYEIEGKISDSDYAAMQKMTPAEKNQQIQLMLQSLLKDRMKLKVHLGKREETIYALEVAKGGMKLAPAKEGVPQRFGVTHHGQDYQFTATGGNLDGLALQLGRQPEIGGRSVVNRTGITGNYDVAMHWTRTGSAAAAPDDASAQDESGPSFFTAIQEQLGLRLATTKGQVDYLVVDHIERPWVDGAEVTPIPTQSPLGEGAPGSVVARLGRAVSAQKLSDTGGVDFSSYIQRIQSDVGRNGAPLTPSNASRLSKSGVVAVRLVLLPDGRIGAMKLGQSSGNADLDKAAWYAITSEGAFPPLPSAFHGPQVELLLKFFYNTDVVEPSASLVPVAMAQEKAAGVAPAATARLGGGVSAPVLIRSVEPEFTERARQVHASGVVLVNLLVDEEGNPRQVQTLRGLGMGLDQKAIEAVK